MIINTHSIAASTNELFTTAARIARESRRNFVGTEHMLIAMCRDPQFLQYLIAFVDFPNDEVDEELASMMRADPDFQETRADRLSPRLQQSLDLAAIIAEAEFQTSSIEPHHVLLGILRENTSYTANTLWQHGITYESLLQAFTCAEKEIEDPAIAEHAS